MMKATGEKLHRSGIFAVLGISFLIAVSTSLLAVGAVQAFADNQGRVLVGAPVERGARTLEIRTKPDVEPPIAYSFRTAAEDSKPEAEKANDPDALAVPQSSTPPLSSGQQYCSNIIDETSAAQIAQQTRNLEKAKKQIDDRIALLNAKAEVLQKWMKLREDFTERATDSLVQIYSKMKPDSAAAQLAAMDEMTSAAIIAKLVPKVSSPIMAEMDVAKAARLSAVIAGSGELAIQPGQAANAKQ